MLNFRGCSRQWNYFNSEIFMIYGSLGTKLPSDYGRTDPCSSQCTENFEGTVIFSLLGSFNGGLMAQVTVISPTEPEVTRAHTNLFLTRGCGIEELCRAQILDGNLALLLLCKVVTRQRSTVYTRTRTIFLSSNQNRNLKSAWIRCWQGQEHTYINSRAYAKVVRKLCLQGALLSRFSQPGEKE